MSASRPRGCRRSCRSARPWPWGNRSAAAGSAAPCRTRARAAARGTAGRPREEPTDVDAGALVAPGVVRQPHALGPAGGARRVDDGGEVVGPERLDPRRRRRSASSARRSRPARRARRARGPSRPSRHVVIRLPSKTTTREQSGSRRGGRAASATCSAFSAKTTLAAGVGDDEGDVRRAWSGRSSSSPRRRT